MRDLENKKTLVVGLGTTGKALIKFLLGKGAVVTGADENRNTSEEIKGAPIKFLAEVIPTDYDYVFQSPGVSRQHDFFIKCDENQVPVLGEIELAGYFNTKPVIGITGTNGKTTITEGLGHVFRACGHKPAVVGNIGTPFIQVVEDPTYSEVIVELSSYQLESVETFSPQVAIISNLSPDHLERHKDMDNYLKIKSKIAEKQDEKSYLILNADDVYLNKIKTNGCRNQCYFSLKREVEGIYVDGDQVYLNLEGQKEAAFKVSDLKILGNHNLENMLAVYLAARLFGLKHRCLLKGLTSFQGVEHRLEYLGDIRGVSYYNDSKATNPESTVKALGAFKGKRVYVILGGSPKDLDYQIIGEAIKGQNVFPILQGETKDEIKECLAPDIKMMVVDSLKEATLYASKVAKQGEVILLSPGCASFDQFKNFEERGQIFKEYFNEIKREQ